jgi:hypothetical protein
MQEVLDYFMKHGKTEEEEQRALTERLQVEYLLNKKNKSSLFQNLQLYLNHISRFTYKMSHPETNHHKMVHHTTTHHEMTHPQNHPSSMVPSQNVPHRENNPDHETSKIMIFKTAQHLQFWYSMKEL